MPNSFTIAKRTFARWAGFADAQIASADFAIARTNRRDHALKRHAKAAQLHWIDHDVVLLHETANARHLGDAFGLGQRIAQLPVLRRPQFAEIAAFAGQGILVDPADARGIGPQ